MVIMNFNGEKWEEASNIGDEIISLLLYGKPWETLEFFDNKDKTLEHFKYQYLPQYNLLKDEIFIILNETQLGFSDYKNMVNFLKILKPSELFYFINYTIPITNIHKIGENEQQFFHEFVNECNSKIIEIFNEKIFKTFPGDERDKSIVEMLDIFSGLSQSPEINYNEDLLYHYHSDYLLSNQYSSEGYLKKDFIYFMHNDKDMFLFYILKIYNLKTVFSLLPVFKEKDLTNESYRLLHERFTTMGSDYYTMPLEWHLELVKDL